jgi:primosomal protein N' (replication factor Y)
MQRNFGTERIEEVLDAELPDVRVGRMDLDAIRNKNAHDVLIQQFEQKKLDVLVGTQMVVKGLDFDNVDLVGILDADGLLHFADFRVNERAFQLMEQVSGRAGRKDAGKVMIQTGNPVHPILEHIKRHDYVGMFNEEIEKRKQFFYPPFSKIIHISFRHKDKNTVQEAAYAFAKSLETQYGRYIVGPAEPVISRVRNLFLMEMLLKLPRDSNLVFKCKTDLLKQFALLHNDKKFRSVIIVPDVDAL